jgi:glycosyltransferase involved in cell wall biosynthesis
MRVAWFSPLPPVRSGIAAVNASLLPRLHDRLAIDCFVDRKPHPQADLTAEPDDSRQTLPPANLFDAHDWLWKRRRAAYDLVVYQLGNASCHDYMWAYLARYPGLVVLHDPRLHHARARQLLSRGRFDDYRREFWYDHPDAVHDFVEYAVDGLGGPIYYAWSMLRVVMRTARLVAVHNERVASDLREAFPGVRVESIRLGTPPPAADPAARGRIRSALGVGENAVLFASFGKVTAEKRIDAIVRALGTLAGEGADVHLLLAGDASGYASLARDLAASAAAARVHTTGYLPDAAVDDHLAAADACLCLRWPTALESSASWLQCLAAGRPTVVSDLAHLVDVPTIDPRSRRVSRAGVDPVAIAIDLLDEERALVAAMRALAGDRPLRETLGRAGRDYWSANHTVDAMAADYRRIIALAVAQPAPRVTDLPAHFLEDHTGRAREQARRYGVDVDILHEALDTARLAQDARPSRR